MDVQSDVPSVVNLLEGANKCMKLVVRGHNAVSFVSLCCRHEARLGPRHGGRFSFSRCMLSWYHRGRIIIGSASCWVWIDVAAILRNRCLLHTFAKWKKSPACTSLTCVWAPASLECKHVCSWVGVALCCNGMRVILVLYLNGRKQNKNHVSTQKYRHKATQTYKDWATRAQRNHTKKRRISHRSTQKHTMQYKSKHKHSRKY